MSGGVVIASGGTGGHMYPAIALGESLARRGHAIAFAVDARGARYLPATAERFLVRAASPAGGRLKRLAASAQLGLGVAGTLARFLVARPRAVAAFGGYASVPTGLAAALLRVPLVLHEQNAVLGRAHRLLLRFARRLTLTFEPTQAAPDVARDDIVVVGNPVRAAFADIEAAGRDGFNLFIVGGSQGATIFADVVPEAVVMLSAERREGLRVVQQCRAEDLDRVVALYQEHRIDAEVRTFFDDMPERLAAADLVISRSGASSVAELLVAGKPALFVAYPHAADDHQQANANAIAAAGAAVTIAPVAFTAERLAAELERVMDDPEALARMADRARALARPDAAERLADIVEEVMR